MYHFKFLGKYRTYVPSYKYDFIRFTFNSFVFGFALECYLIFFKKYDNIYKSSYTKELEKVKSIDEKIGDKIRKNILLQQKKNELQELEEALKKFK
jgi:hypothetical protein